MSPSGVLVECDASIKAIILKIDQDKHDYIVEDLDDHTLVIKENQLSSLKARLEEVSIRCLLGQCMLLMKLPGASKHSANARRFGLRLIFSTHYLLCRFSCPIFLRTESFVLSLYHIPLLVPPLRALQKDRGTVERRISARGPTTIRQTPAGLLRYSAVLAFSSSRLSNIPPVANPYRLHWQLVYSLRDDVFQYHAYL